MENNPFMIETTNQPNIFFLAKIQEYCDRGSKGLVTNRPRLAPGDGQQTPWNSIRISSAIPKKTYEIPVKPLYNPIIKPLNAINARITYVVIVLYNPIVTSLQSHQIPIEPH